MSETFLLTLMFLVTAPMGLMPAIVAWLTRHTGRKWVVAMNLALWAVAYASMVSFASRTDGMFLPVSVLMVAWVALFAYAVRAGLAAPAPEEAAGA